MQALQPEADAILGHLALTIVVKELAADNYRDPLHHSLCKSVPRSPASRRDLVRRRSSVNLILAECLRRVVDSVSRGRLMKERALPLQHMFLIDLRVPLVDLSTMTMTAHGGCRLRQKDTHLH